MATTGHIFFVIGVVFAVTFFVCGALVIPAIEWSRSRRG